MLKDANLIRYKLSKEFCERYVNDLVFRDLVDSRGHVWEFRLSSYPHYTLLNNVAVQSLVDVTFLSRVHTLELFGFYAVIDVSALSSVHTLTLKHMDGVTDVSALSSVKKLTISNCPNITFYFFNK